MPGMSHVCRWMTRIPPEVSTINVFNHKLQGLFLNGCFSSRSGSMACNSGYWLVEAASLQDPGMTLAHSLQALSWARVAKINNDKALVRQAQRAYVSALVELRRDLQSYSMVVDKGRTLAACMALALYEVKLTT